MANRRAVTSSQVFLITVIAGSLIQSSPALAAFPGANGLVVFQSNRDGNAEIYVMNADGTGQTNLTNSPAEDTRPAWSADGSKIAFSSNRGGDFDIYIMNADGTGVTRVTNDAATDISPAWSPDGSRIAFARFVNGYDIWTINVDGTGLVNLTNHPAEDQAPAWSPDGSKIAFRTSRGASFDNEIFVMNPDGTGLVNLTNDPGWDDEPNWSPDGSQLLFSSYRSGSGAIWVMWADGTVQTPLTATPNGDDMPAWSPDGAQVVFKSFRNLNDEIYVMHADGTNQVRLTNNAPPGSTIPEDWFPDWQPLVTPPTIEAEIQQLIQDVEALNLSRGMETALLAHLKVAFHRASNVSQSDDVAATGALQAFINQLLGVPVLVDASGAPIAESVREGLIDEARHVIDRLSQ